MSEERMGHPKAERYERYREGYWFFQIDIEEGRVTYDSDKEEWTLNGSVEGRMARPLAEVVAKAFRTLVDERVEAILDEEERRG